MTALKLLALAFTVIFVVDISGAMSSFKEWYNKEYGNGRELNYKPLDCSLCMVWWTGLAYVVLGELPLGWVAFVALEAAFARSIGDGIFMLRELITKGINNVLEWIEKDKN